MYAYMTDEDFHNQCAEMVNTKTHAYDFSRAFLGPKGAEGTSPRFPNQAAHCFISNAGDC